MNKILDFINNNGVSVLFIQTEGTNYIWWWELERQIDTIKEAEAIANDEENENTMEGSSCAGFDSLEEAMTDYFNS